MKPGKANSWGGRLHAPESKATLKAKEGDLGESTPPSLGPEAAQSHLRDLSQGESEPFLTGDPSTPPPGFDTFLVHIHR